MIPFAGVAGKAIDIGGKEGALFLGKQVAVDCISYVVSYSVEKAGEQEGLPPAVNILLSLGLGAAAGKVASKIRKYSDLRLPQGNELGASPEYWIPGGYTIGGIKEAVIDSAPIGTYTFKHLF